MRDPKPEELEGLANRVRCYVRDAWTHMKGLMPVPLTDPWLDSPGSEPA